MRKFGERTGEGAIEFASNEDRSGAGTPREEIIFRLLLKTHPQARCALNFKNPFQLLVAAMLSAHSTDAAVNRVTPELFRRYPRPEDLARAEPQEIEPLIREVGLYRAKARHLVGMARALVERHEGEVPSEVEALLRLPGVGRKTAHVVLSNAFGLPALAVDTHVFRVARRLGLAQASTPRKVEEELTRLFPPERWGLLHHLLIWHGRLLCRARNPRCLDCPLSPLCPSSLRAVPIQA